MKITMLARLIQRRRGFTLIEILMAVAILSLIAAIIVPRFNAQIKQSGTAKTKAGLEILRTVTRLYYEQEGVWPNSNLSNLTDGSAPSGKKYLPVIPAEGGMNLNRVVNISDYAGGWIWDTATHTLRPNLLGTDANGVPYNTY